MTKNLKRALVFGLTAFRLVAAAVIIAEAAAGRWLAVLTLAVLGFASDFFDGWLARRWRVVTTFGMAFDPLTDKILCLTLLAVIAVAVWPWCWLLFAVFFSYDAFTTTLRFALARPMPASPVAKKKTALLMVGLTLVIASLPTGPASTRLSLALAWTGAALIVAAAVLTLKSFATYTRALSRSLTWLEHQPNVAAIDFAAWHDTYGITAVLFDIEGTLTPWGDPQVDPAVIAAIARARAAGIKHIGLVTNMHARHQERAAGVATQVGAATYHLPATFYDRKPRPIMVHAALRNLNVAPGHAAFVGDKLVDVLAGRRAGVARVAWVNRLGDADAPGDKTFYRPLERLIKRLLV